MSPDQVEKAHPAAGVAVTVISEVSAKNPVATSTAPLPEVAVASWYWVSHAQWMALSWSRVKGPVEEPDPAPGMLPLPVHPVTTCWVVPSTIGEPSMLATTFGPAASRFVPIPGEGDPWGEVTTTSCVSTAKVARTVWSAVTLLNTWVNTVSAWVKAATLTPFVLMSAMWK